jgi:hypothetical protein
MKHTVLHGCGGPRPPIVIQDLSSVGRQRLTQLWLQRKAEPYPGIERQGQVSTNTAELEEVSATQGRQPRHGLIKLLVFLGSLALSVAGFLAFDWAYSAAISKASQSVAQPNLCRVPDPVRHHALMPNCTSTVHWGKESFTFNTNSIGFRDENIRDVPRGDPRPRILLLGDSFTEGQLAWSDTYAGKIAASLPQYSFLDGGATAYSPSNYFNVAKALLADGYDVDEVIVFLDATAVHYEAAFYRDKDAYGAVYGPAREQRKTSWYGQWRFRISSHLFITADIVGYVEQQLVKYGYFHLVASLAGADTFDLEWAAWPYRGVNETDAFPSGYAPLGLGVGLAKQTAKMTLLWQELERHNIPLSVVVYPYPGQLVHDKVDSQQVRIWQQWCQGKCKRFLSLYPEFFAVRDSCPWLQRGCWYDKLFLFGDVHYTGVGNAMVASAVVSSLMETPAVKRQEH